MKKIVRNKNFVALSALSIAAVIAGTSAVQAVTGGPFFSINAGDPGSYSSSTPTTWTDLSTSNRNGTIVNSPLTYNATTKALEFTSNWNGSGNKRSDDASAKYVDMGTGFNNFGSGITIEFEAHFGSATGPWERIFDFGNGMEMDNIWVGNYASTDEIAIELWRPVSGTQTATGRCRTGDAVNALPAGTFKKFVITLDGSSCRIYINGAEVNTVVDGSAKAYATNTPSNNSFDVFYDDSSNLLSAFPYLPNSVTRIHNYIGRSNWAWDGAFDGAIKYVRIYTEALTPADVTVNSTTYTLSYATTGSDSGTSPANRTGNGLISLDGNTGTLTKAGNVFQGWATSANQTTAISGSYNLIANTTLYPAFLPNTYTVTYDEQGGSSVTDGTFSHGGSLTYPANPSKSGYTFQGWFANSSGGSALTATAVAAGNASTTLYAQWAVASSGSNGSGSGTGSGTSGTTGSTLAKTGSNAVNQMLAAMLLVFGGTVIIRYSAKHH